MNIWIFNHYAAGKDAKGPSRHHDLSEELIKRNHRITIFTSNFSHWTKKYIYNKNKSFITIENDIDYVYVKTNSYEKNDIFRIINMVVFTFNSFFSALKVKKKPDIIIGSLAHPGAVVVAYFLSKIYKVPFYFEERDLWPQSIVEIRNVSERNPLIWLLYRMEKFFYSKATGIIVLFEPVVEYIVSKGIEKKKIIFLPNGTALKRMEVKKSAESEHIELFEKLKGKFIITYLGSHGIPNHLSSVLELADLLKANSFYQFVLIGNGTEKNTLMQRVQDYQLKNVHFLPQIPKNEIGYFLNKSSAGIITIPDLPIYKWGISPNKMYDYMGAGLPIIMQFSHPKNIVNENRIGIVSASILELAKKIEHTAVNEWQEMARNSKNTAQQYSWSLLADRLEEELKKNTSYLK